MHSDNLYMIRTKNINTFTFFLLFTLSLTIGCENSTESEEEIQAALDRIDGNRDDKSKDLKSDDPNEENQTFSEEIICESDSSKKVCKLSDKRRILSFKIDETNSSAECFLDKKNLRVLRFARKIIVNNGCRAIIRMNTGFLNNEDIDLENANLSIYDFGDITLTKRYRKGSEVIFNNASGIAVYTKDGLGVAGGDVVADQINYDPSNNTFQAIGMDLPENSAKAHIEVSRMFQKEGERAIVLVLNDENIIMKRKVISWKNKDADEHTKIVKVNTYGAAKIIIAPLKYKDQGDNIKDSSDFFVKSFKLVNYEEAL